MYEYIKLSGHTRTQKGERIDVRRKSGRGAKDETDCQTTDKVQPEVSADS
jgi:hypothetical protein